MDEYWGAGLADHWLYLRYLHSWTSQPLREDEAPEFLSWLLDEQAIARRAGKRGRRQKNFFQGKYECLQGKWPFRESNFTQRLYVGFQALIQVGGETSKAAYIELLELPSVKNRLGRSNRGQRSKRRIPSLDRQVETIRSLCNKFTSPFKDQLLEMRVGEYRRFQMHEFEIAEHARAVEQVRKLIADGTIAPYSPTPLSNPSDLGD